MRAGGADDGVAADIGEQRVDAGRVVGLEQAQRHRQVGLAKGIQHVAPVKKRHRAPQVPLARLGQHVQDERLPVGLPVPFQVAGAAQAALQVVDRLFYRALVDRELGSLCLDQPEQHVGGQIWAGFILDPPAPPAVVMLLVVQPLQAQVDHVGQFRLQIGPLDVQFLERAVGQDVGQEAAHRLLGAFVGIVLQVVEPIDHAGRQRWVHVHG